MKIKIYGGLSIQRKDVQRLLPKAHFSSPIKRNDLLCDIDMGFNIIGIADGVFEQELPVSVSEIMDALRCGLKIYGTSSIGALRAVELESYGMVGCGNIFELIRNNSYFRDDFLGQIFIEDSLLAGSMPFIDLWWTIRSPYLKNLLSLKERDHLIDIFSHLNFRDRSIRELKKHFDVQRYPQLLRKFDKIERYFKSLKQQDGLELLKKIKKNCQVIRTLNARLNSPTKS